MGANRDTLFLDDELNVLPLSKGKDIQPIDDRGTGPVNVASASASVAELSKLKEEVGEGAGVAEVVKCCKTLDQARCLLNVLNVLSSSSLSSTVSLTAARGRGKSAMLGLALSAAVAHGYSNMFVTSPSPENLRTLFEFLFKGLQTLGYEETTDWDLQRGSGEWKDVVVRVNIFRNSRQTIQYIDPADHQVLGQAELVVIDEAAAIPLPTVKNLLGPYLVFLSSTINGYEGTGRSLSLKLIQQLRDDSKGAASSLSKTDESLTVASKSQKATNARPQGATLRSLKELTLDEPIRYSHGDQIESWLNQLLCLDATLTKPKSRPSHPAECSLFMVNRDALFSFHPASELFLQKMMALYVSSHYKNSPNDLQLMSDAPSHRLFVLLALQSSAQSGSLPEPLAVLQIALEGNIAKQSVMSALSRGERSSGDLIPWTLSQQFQDYDFASLNGVRVVRLAVHPQYAQSGYGSRALECMRQYYAGELMDADAIAEREAKAISEGEETFAEVSARKTSASLQSESITLRDATRMPALLQRLSDRRPEPIDWLGVSFGLTPSLLRFWKKAGYTPLYVRQASNDLTGEHTTVMLRGTMQETDQSELSWLSEFSTDFRKRFAALLGFKFRSFSAISALNIFEAVSQQIEKLGSSSTSTAPPLTAAELRLHLTPFDMKRLDAFGNNMLDYSVVLDLLPVMAQLYFSGRIRTSDDDEAVQQTQPEEELAVLKVTALQSAILLAVGLQRKDPSDVMSEEFDIPLQQGVALLAKAVRRMLQCLRRVERRELAEDEVVGEPRAASSAADGLLGPPQKRSIEGELASAGRKEVAAQRQRESAAAANESKMDASDLSEYAIGRDGHAAAASSSSDRDWAEAERRVRAMQEAKAKGASEEELKRLSTIVSVKSLRDVDANGAGTGSDGDAQKKRKKDSGGSSGAGKKSKRAR